MNKIKSVVIILILLSESNLKDNFYNVKAEN